MSKRKLFQVFILNAGILLQSRHFPFLTRSRTRNGTAGNLGSRKSIAMQLCRTHNYCQRYILNSVCQYFQQLLIVCISRNISNAKHLCTLLLQTIMAGAILPCKLSQRACFYNNQPPATPVVDYWGTVSRRHRFPHSGKAASAHCSFTAVSSTSKYRKLLSETNHMAFSKAFPSLKAACRSCGNTVSCRSFFLSESNIVQLYLS